MDYLHRSIPNVYRKSKVVDTLNMLQKESEYKGEQIRVHTLINSLTDLLWKTWNKSKTLVNFEVANAWYKLSVHNGGNWDCFTFYKKSKDWYDLNLFNFNVLPYKWNVNIYNDLQNDDFFNKTKINKEVFIKEINRRYV